MRLYRLDTVRFGARELAQVISASTVAIAPGARGAQRRQQGPRGARASRSTGSRTKPTASHQQAVGRLFDEETNPIAVMKWKETLDFLEEATDRCEDVANVIEGVVVKHG